MPHNMDLTTTDGNHVQLGEEDAYKPIPGFNYSGSDATNVPQGWGSHGGCDDDTDDMMG